MQVTLKLQPGLPSLRTPALKGCVEGAIDAGHERFGMKLLDYTLEKDGLSLVVMAPNRRALSRGIQGISVRIARAVNRKLERKGRLFADRYDAQLVPKTASKSTASKPAVSKASVSKAPVSKAPVSKAPVSKLTITRAAAARPATARRKASARKASTSKSSTRKSAAVPASNTSAGSAPLRNASTRSTARAKPSSRSVARA